jgi:hypothetical protein
MGGLVEELQCMEEVVAGDILLESVTTNVANSRSQAVTNHEPLSELD